MSDSPSTTASNGRTGNGRFAPSNKYAKGNPFARRVARLRSTLLKAVKPTDLRDVVAVLLTQAKAGDVASIKELLQRLLGPPVELDFVERLDALEQQISTLLKRGDSW
ncbi:MAG: hypothetical protein NTU53_16515 [Planctomycetota bacterium]|nr:hypothetical protein [Planctomycetota bacterium]